MARTVDQIQKVMDDYQAGQPELDELNSPSQTAIYRLFKYIVALAQLFLEQLIDAKKVEIEAEIAAASPGSDVWIKQKVLEFQYSAVNPQALVLDANLNAVYPVVDPTLRIITRCSVTTNPSAVTQCVVTVAKGEPPQALSSGEYVALGSYLRDGGTATTAPACIGSAGINYVVISNAPDRVFVEADILYDGTYIGVIKETVIAAINQWLTDVSSAVNFNGVFRIDDMREYVRAVPGVIDLDIKNFAHRASGVIPLTYLINTYVSTGISFSADAGYAISEDTAGSTLADKLTFNGHSL